MILFARQHLVIRDAPDGPAKRTGLQLLAFTAGTHQPVHLDLGDVVELRDTLTDVLERSGRA